MYKYLKLERERALARLTLNRPQEANALNIPLAEEFGSAVIEAESDPYCHVLLVQGSGRFFCAGGDVQEMADSEDQTEYLRTLAATMSRGVLQLVKSRLIVIAVVDGPAAGAGLGIVLNSDFVLASPLASFMAAYAGVGLTPDCGVSYLLPRTVGTRRAGEMCLSGRVVSAGEAVDWGLINEVHPASELFARAGELGDKLSGEATQTLGKTKRLLNAEKLADYATHLEDEVATISSMISFEDTRNRISAFVERSKARSKT